MNITVVFGRRVKVKKRIWDLSKLRIITVQVLTVQNMQTHNCILGCSVPRPTPVKASIFSNNVPDAQGAVTVQTQSGCLSWVLHNSAIPNHFYCLRVISVIKPRNDGAWWVQWGCVITGENDIICVINIDVGFTDACCKEINMFILLSFFFESTYLPINQYQETGNLNVHFFAHSL